MKGDAGIRLGFNVGAMYDINDKFTVGVSYRSKVKARVKEGDVRLSYANELGFKGLLGQVNGLVNQLEGMGIAIPGIPKDGIQIPPLDQATFSAELPLPDNWNVGLTYKPTDRWGVS